MKKFQNGDFSLLENIPFKDIFGSSRRKQFTAYLLECFGGFPKGSISPKDILVWNEKILEKFSFDDKEYRADVVVTYKNTIYDFEAFLSLNSIGLIKSICYVSRIFSSQFDIGDEYQNVRKVIQVLLLLDTDVSLNEEVKTRNFFSYQSKVFTDLEEVRVIRFDKIDGSRYNVGNSDNEWDDFFDFLKAKNQKTRDQIVERGNDKMLEEINEFVKRFLKNNKVKRKRKYYNFQEMEWYFQGETKGREESNRKFARYLESSGKNIEEISNTMEIPVCEVKKLLGH